MQRTHHGGRTPSDYVDTILTASGEARDSAAKTRRAKQALRRGVRLHASQALARRAAQLLRHLLQPVHLPALVVARVRQAARRRRAERGKVQAHRRRRPPVGAPAPSERRRADKNAAEPAWPRDCVSTVHCADRMRRRSALGGRGERVLCAGRPRRA
eukprot:1119809-Pleurochrysis_carterae.AAC.4